MFFALVQNYAQAWAISSLALRGTTGITILDMQSDLNHEIVPEFWQQQSMKFDFTSDNSFQKYLNADHPFDDILYVPWDLAPINSNFTANAARKFTLRQEAGDMFADMAWHFRDEFKGDRLAIVSAYRSKWYQDSLVKKWCRQDQCALWWTSEHQAGLAIDLRVVTKSWKTISMDTPNIYTDWLHTYAYQWWFHNTYQKWVEIDGKIVEWRHRRYLWTELAKILMDNNQTLAEYYKTINN